MSNTLKEFIRLAKTDVARGEGSPDHENPHSYAKLAFHSKGRAVLRRIAKEMGLQSGTYDIRSNLGGVGVSGEVTLHGEHIYICFSADSATHQFMYRSCNGRKDYTGGSNNWMSWEGLNNLPTACGIFRREARLGNPQAAL